MDIGDNSQATASIVTDSRPLTVTSVAWSGWLAARQRAFSSGAGFATLRASTRSDTAMTFGGSIHCRQRKSPGAQTR
jgi:hypothetical protein